MGVRWHEYIFSSLQARKLEEGVALGRLLRAPDTYSGPFAFLHVSIVGAWVKHNVYSRVGPGGVGVGEKVLGVGMVRVAPRLSSFMSHPQFITICLCPS